MSKTSKKIETPRNAGRRERPGLTRILPVLFAAAALALFAPHAAGISGEAAAGERGGVHQFRRAEPLNMRIIDDPASPDVKIPRSFGF